MAKRATKTKPKPKPKPKPKAKPNAKPKVARKAKKASKAKAKARTAKAAKPAKPATGKRAAKTRRGDVATLDGLSAPIGNEYSATDFAEAIPDPAMPKVKAGFATHRATGAIPETPLGVIDTATHAALVAVNPTAISLGDPRRYPRSKTTPPHLATIAPRGVFLPDRVIVDVEGDTFPSTKLDEHGRDESILPATTLDAIRAKASIALRYLEGADSKNAFDAFLAGFELVPAPFENWNAAGWLLVAMGECAVREGDYARAFPAFRDAMHCPGTVGNPWVHLRLGQARLELADERAADDLSRAYKGGGRSLFEGLDPKYFAVVERSLAPP